MKNVVEIILTSGIITTIISCIMFSEKKQLKYITKERKEWRDTLRRLAEELKTANLKETKKILTKLKVRINTYGYDCCSSEKNVFEDAHIWELISDIEKLSSENKAKDNNIVLKKYQEKMVDYISLLLKDDWERSKTETKISQGVSGNVFCHFQQLL